jgi:hypothetical protein
VRKKPADLFGGFSTTFFLASGKPTPYRKGKMISDTNYTYIHD